MGDSEYLAVSPDQIQIFSPWSGAILEVTAKRDFTVVEKLYRSGSLLGANELSGWNTSYTRELDMTNDSKLFPRREVWEAQGYQTDEYGCWIRGGWRPYSAYKNILNRGADIILSADGRFAICANEITDVALPLYQGSMVKHFDYCAAS